MMLPPLLKNKSEETAFELLQRAVSRNGGSVHIKVGVKEVLTDQLLRSLPSDHRSYAFKAHFDFLVADGESPYSPLFAVEFDGGSHQDSSVKLRDEKKNRICQAVELPILRINDIGFRRVGRYQILQWLVDCWFMQRAFDEAQERGDIDPFEFFHPSFILGNDFLDDEGWRDMGDLPIKERLGILTDPTIRTRPTTPLDPFLPYRAEIVRRFGGLRSARAPRSNAKAEGLGFVVSKFDDHFVLGKGEVHLGGSPGFFSLAAFELPDELAVVDLYSKLLRVEKGVDREFLLLSKTELDRLVDASC